MNVKRAENIKKAVTIAGFICFSIAMIIIYTKYSRELIEMLKEPEKFKAWLESFGGLDRLVFVAIRALQTVVKVIPAEPLEIGAGFAWGTWGGLLYCMLGTEIGSFIILIFSKLLGTKIFDLFIPREKFESISFLNDEKKIKPMLFFLYLIPGTPKDLITYFAALLPINIPTFLIITGIARIPAIITSTWCGQTLTEKNYLMSIIIFVSTLIVSAGGALIYKKFLDRKNSKKKSESGDDIS